MMSDWKKREWVMGGRPCVPSICQRLAIRALLKRLSDQEAKLVREILEIPATDDDLAVGLSFDARD